MPKMGMPAFRQRFASRYGKLRFGHESHVIGQGIEYRAPDL